ncbi:extracellular solute-binding protein [Ruminiclostridium cellobioparum]|uniref:ABC-type sugar transport system, periplasmic component n=1 Tax=Ruminiclostridium cellobioparum subsp. termitidis CT1112 TaxID=1195236 RepID=S0FGM3_RUMCE|nr:extracellular solute-binding protein [Ruminiclostridium cellobioparum]EMS70675.1 ABC-type sugar transport system, periplasmic component [Ruminiclostridium cellobioparum subsp. termitidis CT1112]
MKRLLLKGTCTAVVLSVAMSVLAGCGSGQNAAEQSAAAQSTAALETPAPGSKSEPVKISFMDLWAKDKAENISTSVREALADFQKNNADIIVEEEAIGDQTAYYTKIKTLAASNELPDIFICKGSELAMFAKNQAVAPLDEILDADAAWKEGYVTSAFDDLTSDGKIYAVPYSMLSTHVIYYNKKILADAGVQAFPETWADFKTMIDKIKAKGIVPIALGNKEQWVAESCILSTLGDRFTGPDWFNGIKDNKGAKFTDPDFIKSLAALQELGKAGAFNKDMNSINNDQQKTLYFNGKAAMFMEGSWAIGAVMAGPEEIAGNTEVAVLPSVDGGKGDPKSMSGGAGSGFASGVKGFGSKKEAVAKVLKAISGPEYAKSIAEKGEPTAYKVSDYDKSKVSPLAVKYAEMASKLKFTPIYDSYLNPAVVSKMNAGLQELLISTITPEELAKRIQAEYEKVK